MGAELIGVIPTAGKASRMGELGKTLPKALIEIDGCALLDRAIAALKSLGVARVVVVTGRLGDAVRDHLARHEYEIEIATACQEKPLGLAHAIAAAAGQLTGDFVVLCPDNIFSHETDLPEARRVFDLLRPAFVLLATVSPNRQRDRGAYFAAGRQNPQPNVYAYRAQTDYFSGLRLASTGCVFFNHEALSFLPSFSGLDREHIFRDYLDTIADQRDGLLHLLRGLRYDFSEPGDIREYVEQQVRLRETVGQGVSAILINEHGQVLLQQRDENPNIRYPGHWALFGGTIEDDESASEAVAREVLEEIDFPMRNFGLFREFIQNQKREFAFVGQITATIDRLTLREGQGMKFFDPASLSELRIRPDDRQTLEQYFKD